MVNRSLGNGIPFVTNTFNMDNGDVFTNVEDFNYAYNNAGTYNVKLSIITRPNCIYDTIKPVTIYPLPRPGFSLNPEKTSILKPDIQIFDNSLGATDYKYTITDGGEYNEANFKHTFKDSGVYEITQYVKTNFGCLDSLTQTAIVKYLYTIFIPNTFSPTNDLINDNFKPVGLGITSYYIEIFNRWGEKVFSSDKPWLGNDMPQGVYMYTIKVRDFLGNQHFYKGTVTLLK